MESFRVLLEKPDSCGDGCGLLVVLPGNSPVLVRSSRLYDELPARELECARQVFTDESSHQCTLNVKSEGVRAFVYLICSVGCFVASLRILLRSGSGLGLRVALHDLDRHVAVAGVNKHPATVDPVHVSICAGLFEPGETPCSDELVRGTVLLAGGSWRRTEQDRQCGDRKQGLHIRLQLRRSDWFEADVLNGRPAAADVRDSAHPVPRLRKRRSR